jgi:hypothetical protein
VTAEELETAMQRAAEAHLSKADLMLWEEEEDCYGYHGEGPDLAGPYCGCQTCIVREVLWASWPYMYRLAHHPDTVAPDLP